MTFACLALLAISCKNSQSISIGKKDKPKEDIKVPPGFPVPEFPADNPYSKAKAELGRMLFYEKILSNDSTIASCSHCHKQAYAFSDSQRYSFGYKISPIFRNAKSLQNVVYRPNLLWDGSGHSLEMDDYASLYTPYLIGGDTNLIIKRLKDNPVYPGLFKKVFGDSAKISPMLIAKAIATFVRTLISGDSPYDNYINGDKSALSESQVRGMKIFFGEKGRCSLCHNGFLFTDGKFHNTGIVTHYFDFGRYWHTKNYDDKGKFQTPTLRNIEVTGPYMHNGEFYTLEEVINHYSKGGRPNILKDTLIKPLNLSMEEKTDLINFLKSLTDKKFISNPEFSDPHIKK